MSAAAGLVAESARAVATETARRALARKHRETHPFSSSRRLDGSFGAAGAEEPARRVVQRSCSCGGKCEECERAGVVQRARRPPLAAQADRSAGPLAEVDFCRVPVGRTSGPMTAVWQRLGIQCKLVVGASADGYEQEADRVASAIAAGRPAPLISALDAGSAEVARESIDPGEGPGVVGADTEERLRALDGRGAPMPDESRAELEERFGVDFSGVRLHSDAEAHRLSDHFGAVAFTHGRNIYFSRGSYRPGTAHADRLLAHELTHVVQQSGGRAAGSAGRIQRVGGFDVKPYRGTPVHGHLEDALRQANSDLVTEAPIPGATTNKVELNALGSADLHKSAYGKSVVGVRGSYKNEQAVLEPGQRVLNYVPAVTRRSGKVGSAKAATKPRVAPSSERFSANLPASFRVADIKPQPAPQTSPTSAPAVPMQQLQRAYGNRATIALITGASGITVQRDAAVAKSAPKDPMHQAGDLLQEVGRWAEEEKEKQKVINDQAVVGLDPKQRSTVESAVKLLDASLTTQKDLVPKLQPVNDALADAQKKAAAANAGMSGGKIDKLEAQHTMTLAREAAGRARDLLKKVGGGVDVSTVVTQMNQLYASMGDPANAGTAFSGLASVNAVVTTFKNGAQARSEAIAPIVFVLKAFLTLNESGHGSVQSAADIQAALDQLKRVMADDFHTVFGEVGDATVFVEFAAILERQLHVEADMAAAGAPGSSRVPSVEKDMKAYFTALAGGDNDKVFDAYRSFAEAFFFHKEVATVDDLKVAVPDLLAQSPSITGTKPLVCTGYASIGSQTLGWAGANTKAFIAAIRADDKTLLTAKNLDDAHALCQVTRKGTTAFVSNHEIVKTLDEGIGPEAVAWTNKTARMFVGKGKTLTAAVDDAMKQVAKRLATLRKK